MHALSTSVALNNRWAEKERRGDFDPDPRGRDSRHETPDEELERLAEEASRCQPRRANGAQTES